MSSSSESDDGFPFPGLSRSSTVEVSWKRIFMPRWAVVVVVLCEVLVVE